MGKSDNTSSTCRYAKPAHKRAARVLCYALTLGDYDAWADAAAVWRACLSAPELAALGFSTLRTQNHNDAMLTAESALMHGAGQPIAPLFGHMDEAAFWADMAEPDELDAYCLASFNRMARRRQDAFLSYGQQHRGVAA